MGGRGVNHYVYVMVIGPVPLYIFIIYKVFVNKNAGIMEINITLT
jgi:hypothetical protein